VVQFEISKACAYINKLGTEERKRVVAALVEGNSLGAVTRMTGVPAHCLAASGIII
jgi:hypothetical protein